MHSFISSSCLYSFDFSLGLKFFQNAHADNSRHLCVRLHIFCVYLRNCLISRSAEVGKGNWRKRMNDNKLSRHSDTHNSVYTNRDTWRARFFSRSGSVRFFLSKHQADDNSQPQVQFLQCGMLLSTKVVSNPLCVHLAVPLVNHELDRRGRILRGGDRSRNI